MSLRLVSVELKNFRNHEHMVFSPKPTGITALCGENGAGKSSIVNAVIFALFGSKTLGVAKASDLVRYGANKDDECSVSLHLEVDEQGLKVVRRLVGKNRSNSECDVYAQDNSGHWKHVAGPAATYASDYIKKRLRMDEKGFTSAILVPQKQVDHLITASRKERGAVIEKLTGITSLTKALEKAREVSRENKKQVSNFKLDPKLTKQLSNSVESLSSKIEKLSQNLTTLQNRQEKLEEKLLLAKTKRDSLQQDYEQSIKLSNIVENTKFKLATLQQSLVETKQEKDEQRKKVLSYSTDVSTQDVKANLKQAQEQLNAKTSELAVLKKLVKDTKTTIDEAEAFLTKYGIPNDIAKVKDKLKSRAKELGQTKEECSINLSKQHSLVDTASRFIRAAETLEQKDGTCPTCLQSVKEVSVVANKLYSDAKNCKNEAAQLEETIKEQKAKITKLESGQKILDKALDTITKLGTTKTQHESAKNGSLRLENEIPDLRDQVQKLEAVVTDLLLCEHETQVYNTLHSKVVKLCEQTDVCEQELQDQEQALKALKVPSEEQMSKARDKVESCLADCDNIRNKVFNTKLDLSNLESEHTQVANQLQEALSLEQAHKQALQIYEESSLVESLVDSFRQERIDYAIPEIISHASQLISQFTNGHFVAVEMSNTFIPSVVDSKGNKIPVSSLSGGEMSVAALALRTAIALMLSGGASGLIILDEVLVSQDLVRSESILYTLKEVCKGQVILIAHSAVVEDVADEIVEL